MFCKNCGNKLKEEGDFCSNCGTKVSNYVQAEKTSISQVKKRRNIGVIGVIVVIVVIGLAFWKFTNHNNSSNKAVNNSKTSSISNEKSIDVKGNTNSNSVNGSSAIMYNDEIYFRKYNKSTLNSTLYKMKKDGKDVTAVLDDIGNCVNLVDGWLYYDKRDSTGDGWSIEKIKLDGTEKKQLMHNPSNGFCSSMCVVNGYIYYVCKLSDAKGCSLVKMNCEDGLLHVLNNGGNKTIYSQEEFSDINVTKDAIYYIKHVAEYDKKNTWNNVMNTDFKICKADLNGDNEKELLKTEENLDTISELVVEENNIYYSINPYMDKECYIYKLKNEDEKTKELVANGCGFNIANDGYIYYKGSNDTLMKVNIQNYNDSKVIANKFTEDSINIAGDWIFYFDGRHICHRKMKIDGTRFND